MSTSFQRAKTVFLSLLIIVVTIESADHIISTIRDQIYTGKYYVWTPAMKKVFFPDKNVLPGIEGPSRFNVNSLGIRGDEFNGSQRYRILVMGASTVECLYLDQDKAWPQLLQKKLCEKGIVTWVGNVGRSGLLSRHYILYMKYLLPQYPKIDVVILMPGTTDLGKELAEPSRLIVKPNSEKQDELADIPRIFSIYPEMKFQYMSKIGFFKKTSTWRLLKKINSIILSYANRVPRDGIFEDNRGLWYVEKRKRRQRATAFRETLPDLSASVNDYAVNINEVINLAKMQSIRLILVTQPARWEKDMSPEIDKLLWSGWIGPDNTEYGEYYSTGALAEALNAYNGVLLKICQERHIECIDAASLFQKKGSWAYDDAHFNEYGAEKMAEILSQYLLNNKNDTR